MQTASAQAVQSSTLNLLVALAARQLTGSGASV